MHSADVRILIVERNPRMRDFLRREFAKHNLQVEGASSGTEMFRKMEEAPFHLLVLDVNTAEAAGRDLLRRLADRYPDIPVILHTYLQDLAEDPALSRITAMVEKSGNPEDLTSMVRSVFEDRYPGLMETKEP